MAISFTTKIDSKGGLDFGSEYNLGRFRQYCKENIGKVLRIELQTNTRTLSQNALYWLYLEVIERETGNNANDMHEYFRRTLLPPKFIKVMGKEIKIPKSTTELKKTEFGDYMDRISAETGVAIPDTEAYLAKLDLAPLR
jgi:hypothetical protein